MGIFCIIAATRLIRNPTVVTTWCSSGNSIILRHWVSESSTKGVRYDVAAVIITALSAEFFASYGIQGVLLYFTASFFCHCRLALCISPRLIDTYVCASQTIRTNRQVFVWNHKFRGENFKVLQTLARELCGEKRKGFNFSAEICALNNLFFAVGYKAKVAGFNGFNDQHKDVLQLI